MGRMLSLALLVVAAVPTAFGAELPRPRGVGPELAKHYKSPDTFACIFNPSIKIPVARINDNYCDCPDGSDEPGTAACAHLSYHSPKLADGAAQAKANTTLALPGFYCKNKGHLPSYLPLTNVNDGVCDYDLCCDGSDEFEGVGGVKCADKCKEIGKEWRKQDEVRQKSMGAALKKRAELVTTAARLRREVEDRIKDLDVQIQASTVKVAEMEGKLAEAERVARGRVVKGPGKAGRVGVLAGLAKTRITELQGGLSQVQGERDRAQSRLAELEQLLTTFKEEYNPNFNDEGVKRAVRAWEDYAARDKDAPGAVSDGDLAEMLKEDGSEGGVIDWQEWERPEESDVDLLYDIEAYLPPTIRAWVDAKLRALRLFLIENGIVAAAGAGEGSGGEDPAVSAARTELTGAQNSLSQQERDLAGHKEDLSKEYGADEVFRALKDVCVSTDSGEYTYELCFLDAAKQRSRKGGGGDTNMGNFAGFETVHVDDELPADGKGLGSGPRTAMRHENGQGCWNGPSRSTLVVLACHEENAIWKIAEEEKCVYRMEVGTPAVCERKVPKKSSQPEKDEL